MSDGDRPGLWTSIYILAHFATFLTFPILVIIFPLAVLLFQGRITTAPGSLYYWPVLLAILAGIGLAISMVLSPLCIAVDFLRRRTAVPAWVFPFFVWAISYPVCQLLLKRAGIGWQPIAVSLGIAAAFLIYWANILLICVFERVVQTEVGKGRSS